MGAQAFSNFSGNQNGNTNEPTSFVAADGFVGPPASPFNPNSPTFPAAAFPSGASISGGSAVTTINGYVAQLKIPVQAVSAAATAFNITVPAGAVVDSIKFATTTAFTGATVSGEIGSASGDASYVAATSVKNGGVVLLYPPSVASTAAASVFLSAPASSAFVFTLAQGTPTGTGSGTLLVDYVVT